MTETSPQPEPTTDFDGCARECRKAGVHTRRWGGCEHATPPEPTVSMSVVYTDPADGYPSIGFDTYTVLQLARLIEPVIGDPLKAAAVARAIVHRHDEQPAAAPVPAPAPTDRAPLFGAAEIETRPDMNVTRLTGDVLNADELPAPADRAAIAAELLPAWEAVYEPGNVSDYLIGYANDEAPAKAAAEAWLRSQAEVTGRLEWLPEEQLATGRYDRWFELVERHDDGIDTGPGLIVRRRVAAEAQQQEPPVHGESVAHLAGYQPDGHDTRDGEQAGGQTPCGPAPDQCDAEAGDPCANHEREQAHDEGEHCFCGPECEGVPTGRHYEVHDETRPVCSCGRFWPCDLAIQPADDAR